METKPLQERYAALQNEILSNHKFSNKSRLARLKMIDPLALGSDDFTSAINHFQSESDELAEKIEDIQKLLSAKNIQALEQEVIDGRLTVSRLNQQTQDLDSRILALRTKTDSYRMSYHFRSVQKMKELSTKKYHELLAETQKYNKARAEYSRLNYKNDIKTENLEDAKLISDLKRKLEASRRKHADQCEELLNLRNDQMNEIESLMKVLKNLGFLHWI